MDINGLIIHCPYWMNKFRDGKVMLRGFSNGKGSAKEIQEELIKRLLNLSTDVRFELTPENLRKFARRERIGIDCSGLVYRVLNELIRINYKNSHLTNLAEVFTGGVHKTNARTLTSANYCIKVDKIDDFQIGDMIRMRGGKHIAIIIRVGSKEIVYAHSSFLTTEIVGVHTALIQITEANGLLMDQVWLEKTRSGEKVGKKYLDLSKGDGVFRLKIFNQHG